MTKSQHQLSATPLSRAVQRGCASTGGLRSVISSLANCGTYIFSSAVDFRVAAEALLECPEEVGCPVTVVLLR